MSVGSRLRWVLDVEGLSIKELSIRSGIPYRTLQQYLSDKRKPGTDHLIKLAKGGIDINWLLLGHSVASLKLIFPGFDPIIGPLAADNEMAAAFLGETFSAVDEFHRKFVEKEGVPLATDVVITSVWSVFSLYGQLLNRIADRIIQKRKDGWGSDDIAAFILTSPVRDEVRSRLKLIRPGKAGSDERADSEHMLPANDEVDQ